MIVQLRIDRPDEISRSTPIVLLRDAEVVEPSHGVIGRVTHVAYGGVITVDLDDDQLRACLNQPRPFF